MLSLISITLLSFFCLAHSNIKDGILQQTSRIDLGQPGKIDYRERRFADNLWLAIETTTGSPYIRHLRKNLADFQNRLSDNQWTALETTVRVKREADNQWSAIQATTVHPKKVHLKKTNATNVQKRYSDNQWKIVKEYEPNVQRQPVYYKSDVPAPTSNDYYTINTQNVQSEPSPPVPTQQRQFLQGPQVPITASPIPNYITMTDVPTPPNNAFGLPETNEKFNYELYYGAPLQRHWFGNQQFQNQQQQQQGLFLSPILPIAIIIIIIIAIISIISSPLSTTTIPVRRSMFRRNDDIDWSALNILDYISMMEEVWRKFDVKDMECQKRVICELHQNEEEFGSMATNVVSMFKYLRYLTLVKLPGDMQNTFADYLHAAEQGRSDKNDCAKVFDTCDFSIKDTYNKYFSKDNKLKKK